MKKTAAVQTSHKKIRKPGEVAVNLIIDILLILCAAVAIYPLWFVLIASVSNPNMINEGKVILLPKGLNFDAYAKIFKNELIWMGYKNSILYTSAATFLDFAVTVPCAYALSRKSMPGRHGFMVYFTITMYVSGGTIPLFLLLCSFGFLDSPLALIIPSCCTVFELIIVRNFFENNLPEALFDAARMDGMGYFKFFLNIAIPLSKAILAVFLLYRIQAHWNAYLGAQMYLYSPEKKTLQQVIQSISAQLDASLTETSTVDEIAHAVQEKQLQKYAVVVVSALPLAIVYPFMQKFFIQGVMVGAVKE